MEIFHLRTFQLPGAPVGSFRFRWWPWFRHRFRGMGMGHGRPGSWTLWEFMLKQRNGSPGRKDAFPSIAFLVIFVQVPMFPCFFWRGWLYPYRRNQQGPTWVHTSPFFGWVSGQSLLCKQSWSLQASQQNHHSKPPSPHNRPTKPAQKRLI